MSSGGSLHLSNGADQAATLAGVILCGGSGTRMGRTRQHKVCEPVLGRAMVVRLIDTLRLSNVGPLVVVVGYRAGSVIETIGTSHPGVVYAYQRDQLGTGHAARIGIEALCKAGYEGPVLITMGDKLFKPELLQKAFNRFGRSGADLLLVSSPKGSTDTAGRLVKLPGRGIMGIVEHRDIDRSLLLGDWLAMTSKGDTLSRSVLRRVGLKYIRSAPKLWRALGPLGSYAHGRGTVRAAELAQAIHEAGIKISVGSRRLGPDEVERYSRTVNQSIYIGGITVLQSALGRIGRDNAQDEYQQEHEGAGKVVNKKLAGCMLRPPQWLNILDSSSNRGRGLVERVYGVGSVFLKDRLGALRKVVRLFSREYGRTGKLFLVRAPGRINLMGRHIDHQGGFIHAVALDCEVLMAVAPRDDDVIRLVNTDPVAFPRREVVINDWRSSLMYRDWLSFVDSDIVRSHLLSTAGDWSNYVLSSAVYQQYRCGQRRLRGMDIAVGGNVPIAAGLSSSSSMVVGSMEAICAVNGLPVSGSDIVKFCGEAEWFVGSRGGSADHAAIKLGKSGRAVRIGFHPFKLSGYVPIPKDAAILVAFSGQHAVKSAGARDRFNERVACYRLGILLLKHKYPHLAGKLEYVCHLSSSRRVVTTAQARRMLTDLPERISRIQLRRRLGSSFSKRLDSIFGSHDDPGYYTIRDVVTYGIGEYERSRISADYLKKNDLVGFGELMLLSHDGDRVNGRFAQSGGDGFSD
ncbi:MAG: galactokinase family protein, partial [Planctomycetota bacterium]